jgi:hypothetical protein
MQYSTNQLDNSAKLEIHGTACSGCLHNAAREQSMMHSSICTMDLRNLSDPNKLIHLHAVAPPLAGSDRHELKSFVHTSWYGLLHVVPDSNHMHYHCSRVTMLSAYKVCPAISMLSSTTAWYRRTRSNAARSAAYTCSRSYLFIDVLAFSSSCGRLRTGRSQRMPVVVGCKYK